KISQFAAAADSAAVIPSSRIATRPTWKPDGPTEARRPLPSGPPANAAARPASRPAAVPAAKMPARYGRASTAMGTQPGPPGRAPAGPMPVGRAASIGKTGTAPRADPVGATTVPVPNAKPGPRV